MVDIIRNMAMQSAEDNINQLIQIQIENAQNPLERNFYAFGTRILPKLILAGSSATGYPLMVNILATYAMRQALTSSQQTRAQIDHFGRQTEKMQIQFDESKEAMGNDDMVQYLNKASEAYVICLKCCKDFKSKADVKYREMMDAKENHDRVLT